MTIPPTRSHGRAYGQATRVHVSERAALLLWAKLIGLAFRRVLNTGNVRLLVWVQLFRFCDGLGLCPSKSTGPFCILCHHCVAFFSRFNVVCLVCSHSTRFSQPP